MATRRHLHSGRTDEDWGEYAIADHAKAAEKKAIAQKVAAKPAKVAKPAKAPPAKTATSKSAKPAKAAKKKK